MSPSRGTRGVTRGYVIPIGGAENKTDAPVILERFVALCGGNDARLAVIPTASRLDDTGPSYVDLFRSLGARSVSNLPITRRRDCEREDYLDALEQVDGVFITGGNQLRLSTRLGGTPVATSLRRLNAAGVHVAGTSAGAAIMPEHMIAGGRAGSTPRENGVTLAPGLGLTNALVIDQHFRQRDRLGRLLSAVSYNPFVSGIGVDEDTAAFIDPDGVFEVVGSGAVTVVDPGSLRSSSMDVAEEGAPVSLIGLTLHVLA
ncbi:MAG: cyanophycinase, partial [Pseudomonadota bacterium]